MMKKLISIVFPTYNESENIEELYSRIINVTKNIKKYNFELICIDNCSTDDTQTKLRKLATKDKSLKLIFNSKNFGHLKSPYYGLLQSNGSAVILISSDLQDPPENIPEFIKKWEIGAEATFAVKNTSDESKLMFLIRSLYYSLLNKISLTKTIKNATGAGIFDKKIITLLREINDPNPYFRGLVCEITNSIDTVTFSQPKRVKGSSKNNLYSLFDLAMLGITNHSRIPLRLMTLGGFLISFLSLVVAIVYLFLKIFFWSTFEIGAAPILIGVFFFGALQAFFIGILGEYIGTIHSRTRNLPLVVEKERINF